MTTEQRGDGLSFDQVVAASVIRLRRLWPRQLDGPDIISEYRRVLTEAPDAPTLTAVVDRVIDETSDGYLPRPGAFVKVIAEATARGRREKLPSKIHSRSIDEAALIDALAYLESVKGTDDEDFAEGLIMSIRKRLPDRGATVEARGGVKFVRADPYRYDPPGTVRFAVRQPDTSDGYEFPRGPLNGGSR